MSFTDPIADMLTRIRNANLLKQVAVTMPSSGMKVRLAAILKDEGFINSFEGMDKTQCLYYKYITIVYSVFKNLIKVTNEP